MKKTGLAFLCAALIASAASMGVFADDGTKVEAGGISFQIPAELADLVIVRTEGLNDQSLVEVYEKASVEAAKAMGEEYEGAGWLFGISRMPEEQVKELRCGSMDGMEIFAENDDTFLIYTHPTDVRMVRENTEEMTKDQEQWSELNRWASENVRQEILANNKEYESEFFTNTDLDIYLSRAAYGKDTSFVLRSLDFGELGDLDPKMIDEDDFIEDLAENYVYEYAADEEAPDGEYFVLYFADDDIRFDFFKADENLIREVRTFDGEEYETLYRANAKEADDAQTSTTSIVKEWCQEIADHIKG